jgi:hypothetical protein
MNKLTSVLSRFQLEGPVQKCVPILSGHIHQSYHIITGSASKHQYILQKINHHVFENVPGLMENLFRIIRHLQTKPPSEGMRVVPELIPGHENTWFIRDGEGNYWRLFQFIPSSHVLDQVRTPGEAYAIAQSFGRFVQMMADFPAPPLHETIPDFHGFRNRLNMYLNVLKHDAWKRASDVRSEIEWIESIVPLMDAWESRFEKAHIPPRITHNDTKWNNVLFDARQRAISVIDLDTVMEGRIAYDFGDGIRTSCNTGKEDERCTGKVSLDIARFRDFTKGYLLPIRSMITETERDTLIFAAQRMTFIIGLRFFTDFLDGDQYYHIDHPNHNLIRCRAQFAFFESLRAHSTEIEDMILFLWDALGEK